MLSIFRSNRCRQARAHVSGYAQVSLLFAAAEDEEDHGHDDQHGCGDLAVGEQGEDQEDADEDEGIAQQFLGVRLQGCRLRSDVRLNPGKTSRYPIVPRFGTMTPTGSLGCCGC